MNRRQLKYNYRKSILNNLTWEMFTHTMVVRSMSIFGLFGDINLFNGNSMFRFVFENEKGSIECD